MGDEPPSAAENRREQTIDGTVVGEDETQRADPQRRQQQAVVAGHFADHHQRGKRGLGRPRRRSRPCRRSRSWPGAAPPVGEPVQ